MTSKPVNVICIFRVKESHEAEFTTLLEKHWPTLREVGLATEKEPIHYSGPERGGGVVFVHIYEWVDEDSSRVAHNSPEVMAIWEPMGPCCEERDGKPSMEFLHAQPLEL